MGVLCYRVARQGREGEVVINGIASGLPLRDGRWGDGQRGEQDRQAKVGLEGGRAGLGRKACR